MIDLATREAGIQVLMNEALRKSGKSGTFSPITVPENSAVGSSASNGRAERTVQIVEDLLRTMKSALENRIKALVPCSHPVIAWMVMHVADVITKFSVNKTGQTPYEELHGKRALERRCEFGERIYYSVPKKARAKRNLRWEIGIYLGHMHSSNELFVGTGNGNVIKARSAVRLVENARWSLESIQKIIGTPDDMAPVEDNSPTPDQIEKDEAPHDFNPVDADPGAQGPVRSQAPFQGVGPDPTAPSFRRAQARRMASSAHHETRRREIWS